MENIFQKIFYHMPFVMSLSGSIIVILYKLSYPFAQKYFSLAWRKMLLKISLVFYLVPIPMFKYTILSCVHKLFSNPFILNSKKVWSIDLNYAINMEKGNTFLGSDLLCMGLFSFIIVMKQIKQYVIISHTLSSSVFNEVPQETRDLFENVKQKLDIKQNVSLKYSQIHHTPMTIGIFSPSIILPQDEFEKLDQTHQLYILMHEFIHIKNRDLFINLLALLVLAIHWYNPICYLLYFELRVASELKCDYEVVKDLNDNQRQQYSYLLIELATQDCKERKYSVGFVNNSVAVLERRILEMKMIKKKKTVLSFVVFFAFCLMGTVTAFSYESPQKVCLGNFNPVGMYSFSASSDAENNEWLPYESFFTDSNGQIFPMTNRNPKIICFHDFVDGSLSEHVKNGKGGCVVTVYKAQRCCICGYIKGGNDIISKTEYTVCPHN